MSLNHVLNTSQFSQSSDLGGRLEDIRCRNLLADEFYVENIDVSGNVVLSDTSEIKQSVNTITPVGFAYLSQINQNLSVTASPTFTEVNSDLDGQVKTAEQKSITNLPVLANIQNQSISSSAWQYVNTLNQNVSSTSNVAFGTLESKGNSATQTTIKTSGGTSIMVADTITPRTTFNCDVVVNGNITYNTITELKTVDPMIALADGNLTNTLDIGIYGTYSTSPPTKIFTGIFRDHLNGLWTFYDNLATEPTTTVVNTYSTANIKYNSSYSSDGTLGNPAYSWLSDTASGLYRIGSNNYGFSINSTKILDLSATGLSSMNILPLANSTYNLGSALLKYSNVYADSLTGTLATTSQPNIATLAGLTSIQGQSVSSSAWQYVNTMNQSVASSSSPAFVSVTANLTGNVTGNCNGSAATVTSATQSAITTLPILASIQGQSVSSSAWQYVNTMNQNVATSSTPSFTGIVVNSYDLTAAARYLISVNQDLGTSNSPSFVSVTANLTGNVTGNCSGSAATVTGATQSAITTLPSLASIQGQSVSSSAWQYVNSMNQAVSSGSSPSFINLTATGDVKTNSLITTSGTLTIQPAGTGNIQCNLTAAAFNINTSAGSTVSIGSGSTALYVNGSNNISLGTTSNPNARQLYVSGSIEGTGVLSLPQSAITAPSINFGTSTRGLTELSAANTNTLWGTSSVSTALINDSNNAMLFIGTGSSGYNRYNIKCPNANSSGVLLAMGPSASQSGGMTWDNNASSPLLSSLVFQTASNAYPITFQGLSCTFSSVCYYNANILPGGTNTYDIGASGNVFKDIRGTNLYGTLQTAAQTNITSVGTLSSLSVNGTLNMNSQQITNLGSFLNDCKTVGNYPTITLTSDLAGGYPQIRMYSNNQSSTGWTHYLGGSSTPAYNLQSDTNYVYVSWNGTSWAGASDSRVKKNIVAYEEDALAKINLLPVRAYHTLDQKDNEPKKTGLIAQEVLNILPEIVSSTTLQNGDERYGISYGDITKFLIRAIQQLTARIVALESQ